MSTQIQIPELARIEVRGHTRAAFLTRASLTAGAVFGMAAVTPFTRAAIAQSGGGDLDIANYALTLEYLEAAFYAQALKEVSGLSGDTKKLATELRDNEDEHVGALKSMIEDAGGTPVDVPTVDFGDSFKDEATFLKTANVFEDLGVSAYNGAGPMIESTDILGAAGSIVQVEARHAALIRLARDRPPAPQAFDKASTMDEVLAAAKPFIKG
ncbi:ferritin-like domain-containing protein [Conexibacter sp. W3-3-2]|uniref:Twin-arginine translocation pathway signal protein n=1 Tax=Paraconexibacter algicola TaxID=2133960 RepID=A0A2T4UHW6_9ACTN|nr:MULTISPECIES: ferritin-like domain-containing protein [Solirubrobacterales]MTD45141.1 ferritin-like domain-containing protein [Conexibacter sp. W3-3-2]PTL58831.1 twin-arginine translocation pathway signal protein [Paraconexibacter algicola]